MSTERSRSANYDRALERLYGRINFERSLDQPYNQSHYRLARMERLLVELNQPQQSAPVIHIAGSKGKGSVAWLLAESLRRNNLKVGLYTSPHLVAIEERFVVDGSPIDRELFAEAVDAVEKAASRIEVFGHGHATFFEVTTAVAWWIFREKKVDAAVIEVGLGGRLDSTNVCWPILSIITSISYDHQAQLGETLGEIAFEKAGIIKPGVPVISGAEAAQATDVIERTARERGCLLRQLGRDFNFNFISDTPAHSVAGSCFDFCPSQNHWPAAQRRDRVDMGLVGRHQAANGSLVLAAVEILTEQGWKLDEQNVRSALAETQVPGRIQVIRQRPRTILDTAHNEASIDALIKTLDTCFPACRRTVIFSVSRDKKWKLLLETIFRFFDRVILTEYRNNPRAVPLNALYETSLEILASQGRDPTGLLFREETPSAAIAFANQTVASDEMLIICGSFFLASEVLQFFQSRPLE